MAYKLRIVTNFLFVIVYTSKDWSAYNIIQLETILSTDMFTNFYIIEVI
jgi:hypothetical protein